MIVVNCSYIVAQDINCSHGVVLSLFIYIYIYIYIGVEKDINMIDDMMGWKKRNKTKIKDVGGCLLLRISV